MTENSGKLEQPFNLDTSLDDVEDLPGFGVWPSGAFTVIVESSEQKKIGEHPALEVVLKLEEVHEISEQLEDDEKQPQVGDIMSYAFMMDNKFGVDNLKKFLKPIGEKLGTQVPSAIIAQVKGMKLLIINKRTYNKDKDQHYGKCKKLSVI